MRKAGSSLDTHNVPDVPGSFGTFGLDLALFFCFDLWAPFGPLWPPLALSDHLPPYFCAIRPSFCLFDIYFRFDADCKGPTAADSGRCVPQYADQVREVRGGCQKSWVKVMWGCGG
jgi:hypothetical protein